MAGHPLDEIVDAKRRGEAVALASICSAHPVVVEETVRHAAAHGQLALVEATCNQVNQDGGYTGMRPADFHGQVRALALDVGLEPDRLLLGGDHLGPNPWRGAPADDAMAKAEELVSAFARAGFRKLHLDASMRCADDEPVLAPAVIAQRCARLAAVADAAAGRASGSARELIRYVIGTEVPVPGGGAGVDDTRVHVTTAADVAETIEVTRAAFTAHGVEDAWERVRFVVAQPGVEFCDAGVHEYAREAAAHLASFIEGQPKMAFEAHSTDYQTVPALRALVEDHFAVLKVGPALTNAYREGVFALSYVEDTLFDEASASGVRRVLDTAMCDNPTYWADYYSGGDAARTSSPSVLPQRSIALLLVGAVGRDRHRPDEGESTLRDDSAGAARPVHARAVSARPRTQSDERSRRTAARQGRRGARRLPRGQCSRRLSASRVAHRVFTASIMQWRTRQRIAPADTSQRMMPWH